MNCQLHAPAVLPPRKETPLPIGLKARPASEPCLDEEEKRKNFKALMRKFLNFSLTIAKHEVIFTLRTESVPIDDEF
jgi:hypothetical protein